MTTLSPTQIAHHAYSAGFRGQDLTVATAIAMAESGGNPAAHNGTPPDNSYGLWQINMLGAMGPERRKQFHLQDNDELKNPDTNAKAAYDISGKGNDFTPWSTYTNKAYKKYVERARSAAQTVTKNHGHTKPMHQNAKHPTSGGTKLISGNALANGYSIDPAMLNGYAKNTRGMADDLGKIGSRDLHAVREIADDSFGKIGKETGFAAALDSFGASMQRQVKGVGTNADTIAASATKSAKTYSEQENQIAKDINQLIV